MKFSDIRRYLCVHSIHRARITSINGAFAAAVVPLEFYDADRVVEALRFLGQADPHGELTCVYCQTRKAESWDHLHSIIKDKRPSGPGHQLGNLVPSCKQCNSKKGKKNWEQFMRECEGDGIDRSTAIERLREYQKRYVRQPAFVDDENDPYLLRLEIIRLKIERLMMEADEVAREMRAGKISESN